MKKTIMGLLMCICFMAFQAPKTYKFEFNEQQLNAVWHCIDNSSAPHDEVKAVEAMLQSQLKGQIDTTKQAVTPPKPKK